MKRDLKELERRVYDQWAPTYDHSCWAPWLNSWVDHFAREIPEGSSLVDVGCGTGNALLRLLSRNPTQLAGIDISPNAIAVARRKLVGAPCDLRVGDAEAELPWGESRFDVAIFNATIHHFPNPERALFNAYRVLKPKGKVIVADPLVFFPIVQIVNVFLRVFPLHGDLCFFTQRQLRTLVGECGFADIRQKRAGFLARYTVGLKADL